MGGMSGILNRSDTICRNMMPSGVELKGGWKVCRGPKEAEGTPHGRSLIVDTSAALEYEGKGRDLQV